MPEFSILGASCLLTISIQVEKPIVSQLIGGMFPETFHQSFQFFSLCRFSTHRQPNSNKPHLELLLFFKKSLCKLNVLYLQIK